MLDAFDLLGAEATHDLDLRFSSRVSSRKVPLQWPWRAAEFCCLTRARRPGRVAMEGGNMATYSDGGRPAETSRFTRRMALGFLVSAAGASLLAACGPQ